MPQRRFGRGLVLSLLWLLGAGGAAAHVLFDFEQPYFVEAPDVLCKDHSVVRHEGLYHVFYIQSLPADEGAVLRNEKWFGHISSPDLRHWTRHDSVLSVDVPDPAAWEEFAVWAPAVMRDPAGGGWIMHYTGVNRFIAQQTGLAFSSDLFDWVRLPANPVYRPSDSWAIWHEDAWSNCRDPELFREEGSEDWYLLNTCTLASADSLGAVSHAVSQDLANWTDLGPLFVNDSSRVLESVRLLRREGHYHLFFTEGGEQGVSHILSPAFAGGWDKENRVYVDLGNAAEITPLPGEDHDLFSRHNAVISVAGPVYFFRFSRIRFDTPDLVPVVENDSGLGGNWSVVFGTAFDNQPTWGDNPRERGDESSRMEGNSYIATYEDLPDPLFGPLGGTQGDAPTGVIRSVDFTVTGDRFALKVGGGDKPGLCFAAMVRAHDHRILFWETGGDSYAMDDRLWNLETLLGETVYLVVADLSADSWGHIATDSMAEYDRGGEDPFPPANPLADGPNLIDVMIEAGFGWSEAAPSSPPPAGRLLAPYPNPFNPRTQLRYEMARPGWVELRILDARGRRVRRLFEGRLGAGPGYFSWDARDDAGRVVTSGLYVAQLLLDGAALDCRKLMLLK